MTDDAPADLTWLTQVDVRTLLSIFDVTVDLDREISIAKSTDTYVRIPMFEPQIKFQELCPSPQVNMISKYASGRAKAAEFLADRKIVKSVYRSSGYYYDAYIDVFFERERFAAAYAEIKGEYHRRKGGFRPSEASGLKEILHPEVVAVSWSRLESGNFADAAEAALKHLNTRVKHLVFTERGKEMDGMDLMNYAFSPSSPVVVLDDLSTISGRSIQKGYMLIAAGAMLGIRNPKAHENLVIDEPRCIHFLFLASLLLSRIDERISPK